VGHRENDEDVRDGEREENDADDDASVLMWRKREESERQND